MSRKKVILFIVEGITDKTCLGYVLSKILNNNQIEFALTDGDITTRYGNKTFNIASEIGDIVRNFRKNILKASDYAEVVHLIDMDGAYVREDLILERTNEIPVDPDKPEKPYYTDNEIFAKNVDKMRNRNKRKTEIINRLISMGTVWKTIPYSLYFFSCNLDHVMHEERNLFEKDKFTYAFQFEKIYGDSPELFVDFIKTPSFAVEGNYNETWYFIKQNENSLKRYTNFHLYFINPKNPR